MLRSRFLAVGLRALRVVLDFKVHSRAVRVVVYNNAGLLWL